MAWDYSLGTAMYRGIIVGIEIPVHAASVARVKIVERGFASQSRDSRRDL